MIRIRLGWVFVFVGCAGLTGGAAGSAMAQERPDSSGDLYADLQGPDLHRYLQDITGFSRLGREDGHLLWGRVSGSRYDKLAADYIKGKFEEFGMDRVWQEPVPNGRPQWFPSEMELTLVGGSSPAAPRQDHAFTSAFASNRSRTTPPGGLVAPVVDIGGGSPEEIAGIDLTDKIALLRVYPPWGVFRHEGQQILPRLIREKRPLAVIMAIHQRGNPNMKYSINGGRGSEAAVWLNLSGADAAYLERVIEESGPSSPPRVRMKIQGDLREGMVSQNTYGLLRGTSEEFIILTAHVDGWFEAATDNASGLSVLMGLARHFARKNAEERGRNMLFVATAGHHTGSVGVRSIIEDHPDIIAKTVMVVNVEHMASLSPPEGVGFEGPYVETPATIFAPNAGGSPVRLFKEALERRGVNHLAEVSTIYTGDMSPFRQIDMPMICLLQSARDALYWYHSDGDTPDKIDPAGLERCARAFATFLDAIDGLSREELGGGQAR